LVNDPVPIVAPPLENVTVSPFVEFDPELKGVRVAVNETD
jgi:hypothetical protein